MNKINQSILIITANNVWSMGDKSGAPSMYNTIKTYADNFSKVYMLTSGSISQDLKNRIKIYGLPRIWHLISIKYVGYFISMLWYVYFQIVALIKGLIILKRYKISIIYAYEIHGVPAAYLLTKLFRLQVVARYQGTILYPYINNKCNAIRLFQHYIAFKIPVDLVIMANDGTKGKEVLAAFGNKEESIRYWRNGIDVNNYDKSRVDRLKYVYDIKENTKILLMVSRLEAWKRVERAIEALPLITKTHKNVRLFIVGDGNERKALEHLVEILRVDEYVVFVGNVQHNLVSDYFYLADVFISLYDLSNAGNPLFEAMKCGRSIVAISNGDTGKIVINGKNGILLPLWDKLLFVKMIDMLLNNNSLRSELAKNAYEYAKRNFWTWEERMREELKEVNKLVLDG